MSWLYVQQKEFGKAFIQERAIYKRNPESFYNIVALAQLAINDKQNEDAAAIFTAVLHDEGTDAQKQVVCANAGTAIATALNISIVDGYAKAQESIESKKALGAFTKLLALNNA